MKNVTQEQVKAIADSILADKRTHGVAAPTVTSSEVITRFKNKGIHASAVSVHQALLKGYSRVAAVSSFVFMERS